MSNSHSHEDGHSDHGNEKKTNGSFLGVIMVGGILIILLLYWIFRPSSSSPQGEEQQTSSTAKSVKSGAEEYNVSFSSEEYTRINIPSGKAVDFFNASVKHRMHRLHEDESQDRYGDINENLSSQFSPESPDNHTFFIKAQIPGEIGTITIHIRKK